MRDDTICSYYGPLTLKKHKFIDHTDPCYQIHFLRKHVRTTCSYGHIQKIKSSDVKINAVTIELNTCIYLRHFFLDSSMSLNPRPTVRNLDQYFGWFSLGY